jgi:hypothetical protein
VSEEKESISLNFGNGGEFYMSNKDFTKFWDKLEIYLPLTPSPSMTLTCLDGPCKHSRATGSLARLPEAAKTISSGLYYKNILTIVSDDRK